MRKELDHVPSTRIEDTIPATAIGIPNLPTRIALPPVCPHAKNSSGLRDIISNPYKISSKLDGNPNLDTLHSKNRNESIYIQPRVSHCSDEDRIANLENTIHVSGNPKRQNCMTRMSQVDSSSESLLTQTHQQDIALQDLPVSQSRSSLYTPKGPRLSSLISRNEEMQTSPVLASHEPQTQVCHEMNVTPNRDTKFPTCHTSEEDRRTSSGPISAELLSAKTSASLIRVLKNVTCNAWNKRADSILYGNLQVIFSISRNLHRKDTLEVVQSQAMRLEQLKCQSRYIQCPFPPDIQNQVVHLECDILGEDSGRAVLLSTELSHWWNESRRSERELSKVENRLLVWWAFRIIGKRRTIHEKFHEFWNERWGRSYNGFLAVQQELAALRDDFKRSRIIEPGGNYKNTTIVAHSLNRMLVESAVYWCAKWGELDLHKLHAVDAARLIHWHVVGLENQWMELKIIAGRRKHHGKHHTSTGTLFDMLQTFFDGGEKSGKWNPRDEERIFVEEVLGRMKTNKFTRRFFSGETSVHLCKPM